MMASGRVNTFGIEIKNPIKVINEKYEKYTDLKKTVKELLRMSNERWFEKPFLYIYARSYCRENSKDLIPAEFAAVVFSFRRGIIECVHGLMDPGYIPFAERSEVMITCMQNALLFPGTSEEEEVELVTPAKLNEILMELAEKHGLFVDDEKKEIFMVATRGDVPFLRSNFRWLQSHTEDYFVRQKFLHLEMLLMEMSFCKAQWKKKSTGIIFQEGGSARFIFNPRYDFTPQIACAWHAKKKNFEKIDRCAKSVALRRVYNCLYYLCHLFNIPLAPRSHVP